MKKILAILDLEEEYAARLSAFINHQSFAFEAIAFTGADQYKEYEVNHTVDILLCAMEIEEELRGNIKTDKVCLLARHLYVMEGQMSPVIFKFQSADEIIKEIMELFSEEFMVPVRVINNKTKIAGICSPAGGISSTLLSLALALAYTDKQKVLMISFDPFATGIIDRGNTTYAISELIYYIKQKREQIGKKCSTLIEKFGEVDILAGMAHWSDMTECTADNAEELVAALSEQLDYTIIIIDIGMFCEATNGLLNRCEDIYIPSQEKGLETKKELEWIRQLKIRSGDEITKRITKVFMPSKSWITEGSITPHQIRESGIWKLSESLLPHE